MFYEGDDTGANDKWYSMSNLQTTYLSPPFILYYIFCGCLTILLVFMVIGAATANSDSNDGENAGTTEDGDPITVLLISLDGFRFKYLVDEAYAAYHPTLSDMAGKGVYGKMQPIFPSDTFPNHYTIVTGLYAESHGIVANDMYDPDMDAFFSMSDQAANEDPAWWLGEALWTTVQEYGLLSASMFWPGSEAEGKTPNYWFPYDESLSYADRVAQVLEWLDLPAAERPAFITLYLSAVDSAGHTYGPDSQEVKDAILEVDDTLASLFAGIEERTEIAAGMNIMVVSDHGMAATNATARVIFLDDYLDMTQIDVVKMSPVANIWLKEGSTLTPEDVVTALTGAPGLEGVFLRDDTPPELQYSNNDRIPPVLAIAEVGYIITTTEEWTEKGNGASYYLGGHGYRNNAEEMAAIFVGQGPAFIVGDGEPPSVDGATEVFNLDILATMADILNVPAPPNNGTSMEQFLL